MQFIDTKLCRGLRITSGLIPGEVITCSERPQKVRQDHPMPYPSPGTTSPGAASPGAPSVISYHPTRGPSCSPPPSSERLLAPALLVCKGYIRSLLPVHWESLPRSASSVQSGFPVVLRLFAASALPACETCRWSRWESPYGSDRRPHLHPRLRDDRWLSLRS